MGYLPHTASALWPDSDTGPFRLRLYWGDVDGRVECVGFELTSVRNPDQPWDPRVGDEDDPSTWRQMEERADQSPPGFRPNPTPVTSSLLRSLNLPTIVENTKRSTADFHEYWLRVRPDLLDEISDREEQLEAIEKLRGKRRRRGTHPLSYYAGVARTYVRAMARKEWPTKAVADEFSVSRSTAARHVRRARELGLLDETTRGKAGGAPIKTKETDE